MVQEFLTPVSAAKALHKRAFGFMQHCSCQAVSGGMRHEKKLGLPHVRRTCGHIGLTQRGGII